MYVRKITAALAVVVGLMAASGATAMADPGPDIVGNATGGGWVKGEKPDFGPDHTERLKAKLDVWFAYDRYIQGKLPLGSFRAIEKRSARTLGVELSLPTSGLTGTRPTAAGALAMTGDCNPEFPCPIRE